MKIICVLSPEEMEHFKAGEIIYDMFESALIARAGSVTMHGSMLAEVINEEHGHDGGFAVRKKPPQQLTIVETVFDDKETTE